MLSVMPLEDRDAISAICRDPWVSRAGHDFRPVAPIVHPDVRYLGAYVDGQLVGAFCLVQDWIETDMHAMLTKQALPWYRDLGKLCVEWIFQNPLMQRVSANVIEGLESAKNYALKIGFKYEGFRRDACMVGGQLRGVHVLAVTRRDWA